MNVIANLSYREIIPKNISSEDFIEVEINTGTQSTLQDVKTSGAPGGFCYNNGECGLCRNRFIYWRSYQDIVELSEISLDITLLKNHVRLRFTDSAVLQVSLIQHKKSLALLVVTVSSLHYIEFPLPGDRSKTETAAATADTQTHSIFYDVNVIVKEHSIFYVLDGVMAINVPHLAESFIAPNDDKAYFALDNQSTLMLYTMNCRTGMTFSNEVKELHLMPRFLNNLKDAFIGRGEAMHTAIAMNFSNIEGQMYLLVLYRNNELRLWSTTTLQIISTFNCIGNIEDQGPQTSMLRKIDENNFCVFLSHEKSSEFVCCSIATNFNESDTISLGFVERQRIPGPVMDLTTFDATPTNIWTLWSNTQGNFNVSTIFVAKERELKWVTAALEPPPDRYCLTVEQGIDPREAYCSYIFHPGRFDRNVIAKALAMFRRINLHFTVKQLTETLLKEQVCQAVEDEIQNDLKDLVVTDEEYLEISTRLWDRFYSCCEQYHIKFSEPAGLCFLNSMEAVCLIRRKSFALLRPCEMLEHLMLVGQFTEHVTAFVAPYCHKNLNAASQFVDLMKIITHLDKLVPEDIKMEMDKKLYKRDDNVIINLMQQITAHHHSIADSKHIVLSRSNVSRTIAALKRIDDLESVINMLLDLLAVTDQDAYPEAVGNYAKPTRFMQSTGALFGSEYGISILTETVKQMAVIRFAVCRTLLIIEFLLYGPDFIDRESVKTSINFLKSYYTLIWISETPISQNPPVNFEDSMQRLTRAQLFSGYTRPYSSQIGLNSHTTLLHLFLQSKGLFSALSMLFKDSNRMMEHLPIREHLLQLVGYVNQMLWPDAGNDVFPEWLFGTCHHIIIQDYVRLLDGWCDERHKSREFMLAVSLLDCGEPAKSIHIFKNVADCVLKEPFLFEQVLKSTPLYKTLEYISMREPVITSEEDQKLALVHYYLKIIQLFEQHSEYEYVIQLALIIMSKLNNDDSQMPMFQSIVFNNHMQLEQYEEAYHALVYNADTSRRKDCLRQLVITLFQCKQFDLLIKLPYNGLQSEFENIVESRARAISIDQNVIYDFLYAFHCHKGNMRKAATVMYERAMRLQVDSDAPDALKKRCASLIICINCLYLVDTRYRWIAKPKIVDDKMAMDQDNDDELQDIDSAQEVFVLELSDIRRELLHIEALKELSFHHKDVSAYEMAGAEELSYLLTTCGLYTAALKLASGHNLSLLPIFESLAAACVSITEDKSKDVWTWLQKNDLADLEHRHNAIDMAWSLLKKLIFDNEQKGSTVIRKCVVNRILGLNAFVPHWLHNSYKLANSRELLYLLVKHNRLLDACNFACEMISGMMGAGSEYFDFKHSVNVTNPQLVIPINTIDLLLHGLKINGREHTEYRVAHAKLQEEVARYVETVKRTTEDKIELAILTERQNRQQQLAG